MDSLAWPAFLEKIREEENNEDAKKVFFSHEVPKFTFIIFFRSIELLFDVTLSVLYKIRSSFKQ